MAILSVIYKVMLTEYPYLISDWLPYLISNCKYFGIFQSISSFCEISLRDFGGQTGLMCYYICQLSIVNHNVFLHNVFYLILNSVDKLTHKETHVVAIDNRSLSYIESIGNICMSTQVTCVSSLTSRRVSFSFFSLSSVPFVFSSRYC